MRVDIKHQRGTAARWTEIDPVLLEGELGIEWGITSDDPPRIKVGDGTSRWSELLYFGGDITWDKVKDKPLAFNPASHNHDIVDIVGLNAAITEAVNQIVDGAPQALDTLREIAEKLADQDDVAVGLLNSVTELLNRDPHAIQGPDSAAAFVVTAGSGLADDTPMVQFRDDSAHGLAQLVSFSRDGMRVYSGSDLVAGFVNGNIIGAFDQGVQAGGASMLGSNDPSEVPLAVKGMAAQVGDLQQWVNSSGTPLAKVDPYGSLYVLNNVEATEVKSEFGSFSGHLASEGTVDFAQIVTDGQGRVGLGSSEVDSNAMVLLKSSYGPNTAVRIRGADVNQTGNLLEIARATGPSLFTFDQAGRFNQGLALNDTNFATQTLAADQRGIVVRGQTSQSADLQQWQRNDGSVAASVSKNGRFVVKNQFGTVNLVGLGPDIAGEPPQYASFFRGGDNGGGRATLAVYNAAAGGGITEFGGTGESKNYEVSITNGMAVNIGLIVKGAASQSGDLQQWKSSAGSVLAKIDSNGAMQISQGLRLPGGRIESPNNDQTLRLTANDSMSLTSPSQIGISARSINWTNPGSNGDAPGGWIINFSGTNIDHGASHAYRVVGKYGTGTPVDVETYSVRPTGSIKQTLQKNHNGGTYDVGHIIKLAAASTSDALQVQDSSGTTLAKIDMWGSFRTSGVSAYHPAQNGQHVFAGGIGTTNTSWINAIGDASFESVRLGYLAFDRPRGNNIVAFTFKGVNGQIADYQQWTSHTDVVQSRITAAGEYENSIAGNGIVLKSPDGTRYRVSVSNGGALSAVAA